MTLAQKRMAAMVMETTVEDVEAHRARQAAAEAEAAAAVGGVGGTSGDEDAAMEQSEDEAEDVRRQEKTVTQGNIPTVSETAGNIKIRTDYVPKRTRISFVAQDTNCSRRFSWPEEPKTGHDNVLHLWATSASQRASRAHAYRVARPPLEITTRCIGSEKGSGF